MDHSYDEKNVKICQKYEINNFGKNDKKWHLGKPNQGFRGAGSPPERYATQSSYNRGQKLVPLFFRSPIEIKFNNNNFIIFKVEKLLYNKWNHFSYVIWAHWSSMI